MWTALTRPIGSDASTVRSSSRMSWGPPTAYEKYTAWSVAPEFTRWHDASTVMSLSVMLYGAAIPAYPPNMITPVWLVVPLAKWKPSQVWSWAPPLKLIPPRYPPPPSNVTPPTVWARTVTGRVRDA